MESQDRIKGVMCKSRERDKKVCKNCPKTLAKLEDCYLWVAMIPIISW